jgi:hypothetical protein
MDDIGLCLHGFLALGCGLQVINCCLNGGKITNADSAVPPQACTAGSKSGLRTLSANEEHAF